MIEEFKSKCCGATIYSAVSADTLKSYYCCYSCGKTCDIERMGVSFKQKALENPAAKKEYDALTTEKLYLENVSNKEVNIYLMNGIKLYGKIIDHDDKTILLHTPVNNNLIYKSAIAAIKVENERA